MRLSSRTPAIQSLEPRRLLSGLTLITHGFQSDGIMPQWVARMAEGVDRRIEPNAATQWTDASRYRLKVIQSGATAVVDSFTRTAGPAPSTSASGEVVIELDWAAASGLSGPSTAVVATAVLGALSSPAAVLGFGANGILRLPMHLIGHSRGGSLVADLARQLGQLGVAVDHLTTLDPFPIGSDPGPTGSVNVPGNVLFADNYYETTDFIVHGNPVAGAANVGPLSLPGGSSLAHSDVHSYYHGTIDRGDTTDGDVTLNTAWYGTTLNRATSGFDASRISGGARPAAGVGSLGGGSAARITVATTASIPFPNAFPVSITPSSELLTAGSTLTFAARYQTHTNTSEIDFYLDTDRNLTNGFTRAITSTGHAPITGATTAIDSAVYSLPLFTGPGALPHGIYYFNAFITDGTAGHVREFTYPERLLVTAEGARLINKAWSDDVGNGDAADPRNYSPGGLPSAADDVVYAFGNINAATPLTMNSLALLGNAQFRTTTAQEIATINLLGTSKLTIDAPGDVAIQTGSLWMSTTSRIDLTDDTMVIDYTAVTPMPTIAASIRNAFAGGTWTGAGIGSSTAATMPGSLVGFAEATDLATTFPVTLAGASLDATSIAIRYTLAGDVNLDRAVGFSDLLTLAQHYGESNALFAQGDVNYDGTVGFGDLLLLAQQYGRSLIVHSRSRMLRGSYAGELLM